MRVFLYLQLLSVLSIKKSRMALELCPGKADCLKKQPLKLWLIVGFEPLMPTARAKLIVTNSISNTGDTVTVPQEEPVQTQLVGVSFVMFLT